MKAAQYERSFTLRREAMHEVLYSKDHGIWYDYDLQRHKHRHQYYASNFAPLFAQCYDADDKLLQGLLWRYINVSASSACSAAPPLIAFVLLSSLNDVSATRLEITVDCFPAWDFHLLVVPR